MAADLHRVCLWPKVVRMVDGPGAEPKRLASERLELGRGQPVLRPESGRDETFLVLSRRFASSEQRKPSMLSIHLV